MKCDKTAASSSNSRTPSQEQAGPTKQNDGKTKPAPKEPFNTEKDQDKKLLEALHQTIHTLQDDALQSDVLSLLESPTAQPAIDRTEAEGESELLNKLCDILFFYVDNLISTSDTDNLSADITTIISHLDSDSQSIILRDLFLLEIKGPDEQERLHKMFISLIPGLHQPSHVVLFEYHLPFLQHPMKKLRQDALKICDLIMQHSHVASLPFDLKESLMAMPVDDFSPDEAAIFERLLCGLDASKPQQSGRTTLSSPTTTAQDPKAGTNSKANRDFFEELTTQEARANNSLFLLGFKLPEAAQVSFVERLKIFISAEIPDDETSFELMRPMCAYIAKHRKLIGEDIVNSLIRSLQSAANNNVNTSAGMLLLWMHLHHRHQNWLDAGTAARFEKHLLAYPEPRDEVISTEKKACRYFLIATVYLYNRKLRKQVINLDKAAIMLRKSTALGYAGASYQLASMIFARKTEVFLDQAEQKTRVIALLQSAAKKSHVDAMHDLALMYISNVTPDKAMPLLHQSAALGNEKSMLELVALCLTNEINLDLDEEIRLSAALELLHLPIVLAMKDAYDLQSRARDRLQIVILRQFVPGNTFRNQRARTDIINQQMKNTKTLTSRARELKTNAYKRAAAARARKVQAAAIVPLSVNANALFSQAVGGSARSIEQGKCRHTAEADSNSGASRIKECKV